jgi:hypothetical protein
MLMENRESESVIRKNMKKVGLAIATIALGGGLGEYMSIQNANQIQVVVNTVNYEKHIQPQTDIISDRIIIGQDQAKQMEQGNIPNVVDNWEGGGVVGGFVALGGLALSIVVNERKKY